MSAQKERLSLTVKIGWAIGEVGIATYVGLTMIYLLAALLPPIGLLAVAVTACCTQAPVTGLL